MTSERITPVRPLDAGDEDPRPLVGGPPRYFALSEPVRGVVLAGTCGRGVARSLDDGRTWSVVEELFAGSNVNSFASGTDGETYAAAGTAGLAVSHDDAVSWSPIDCGGASVYCVAASGQALVAGTTDGIIERGDDGDWSRVADGPTTEVYRLVPLADGTLVAATDGAGVWMRQPGGAWEPIGLDDVPVFALLELDDGDLLAGTRGRGVLRWSRAAAEWREVSGQPVDPVVHAIARVADGTLVAGTGQGVVAAASDGERWRPLGNELAHHRMFCLLTREDGTILAGTYDGVWAGNASGAWQPVDTGLDVGGVFGIAVDQAGIAYAGGRAGVFRSDDHGATWQQIRPSDHRGNAYSFCRSGGDLLVGTDDGLWHAGRGLPGDDWRRAGLDGLRVYTLIELAPGHLLAGTLGDGVWSRPGEGEPWRRSDDGLEHPLAFGLHQSASTGEVFVATGSIVDGVKTGGIFRSADGVRWEPCELEANTVYDVVETSKGVILAGAQRSRILRSDDGGRSFVTTRPSGRDESKMYCLCDGPGDRLYLGAGSELLRSDDAADSWQVVGRGLDGVTIYGVAAFEDGTLLAATSSGVYRSEDSALTWSPSSWSD